MCLAIPMKLVERDDLQGVGELNGVRRSVSLMLCPEAREGDHILVHVGYAIATVDEEEARKTLAVIEEALQGELGE